jgi:hypothetical protein
MEAKSDDTDVPIDHFAPCPAQAHPASWHTLFLMEVCACLRGHLSSYHKPCNNQ